MSKRFWAGLLGGTVFGILFAKKPGKQVRQEISKASKKDGFKGGLNQLGKELGTMGEEFVETIDNMPAVKDAVKSAKEQFRNVAEEGKKTIKKILPDQD